MSAKDRNILLVLPLIAVLVAVWFMLLSPKQDDVKALDAQVSKLEAEVAGQQQAISQGLDAKKRFARSYHRLVLTGKAVPVEDETASLLIQVNRAALASGISFDGITRGAGDTDAAAASTTSTAGATSAGGLIKLPYTLTFRGTFFEIADFVSRIDRLVKPKGKRIASDGRLTTIDGVTLGPDEPRPLPDLLASVNVSTYLAGAAPAASGSGSTATPTSSTTSTSSTTGEPPTGTSTATTAAPASP